MSAMTELLRERLLAREGVTSGPSTLAKTTAFFAGGEELAHFHGDDEIDVRLPPRHQRDYVTRGPVRPRPHPSPWIAIRFESEADVELALEMFDRARAALDEEASA